MGRQTVTIALVDLMDFCKEHTTDSWLTLANKVLTAARQRGCGVEVVRDPEYAIRLTLPEGLICSPRQAIGLLEAGVPHG